MDLVQQPDITHTQGLKELVDLNLNDLNWSQSDDDEHPALVQTRQFLNTLVALPELKALEPYAFKDSGDFDADMRRSPEQLIGFMCKNLIPTSLEIMNFYHPLILGSHSRYISYLQSFVTLITGSNGFLSLIRQLYKIRAVKFSLPQKRKRRSKTASICAEAHGRIQLLYFDLHHVLRFLLFEYQLICDIEFPVKNIQGLLENRMSPDVVGKFVKFVAYHMDDVRHGCERINARDAEVQERQDKERSLPTSPSLYYPPLIANHKKQEIRLLELQPGHTTDSIHCRLVKTDLKTSGHFQALSYVWGKGKPSKTIHVNGNLFRVTLTLEKILRGLRHPVNRRRIWIDAICINQDNNFEKSAQVDLMGSIYQSAEVVIIWLSGDRIDGMAASITQCQDTVGCSEYDFASLADKMESILDQNDFSKKRWWNTVYHFSRCYYFVFIDEWWERLWTVQEACLSSKPPIFLFRGHTFSWGTLEHAVRLNQVDTAANLRNRPRDQFPNAEFTEPMLKELGSFPVTHRGGSDEKLAYRWRANPPSSKPGLETPLVKPTPRNSLIYLIFNCTRQHSKDPRDKIFALRGLLPKHLGLLLYSDYTEEFYETFHRVTGYALCELTGMNLYSKFDTLHATNPCREVLENAPSWTLDFLSDLSSPWNQSEHQIGEEKTFANYLADGDIGYFPQSRDQFGGVATLLTLVCHGAKIDVITANGEFPDIGYPTLKKGKMAITTRHQLRRHKESLIQTVNELQPEEGTPQPEEVALWGMRERYPIHKAIFLGAGEYESSFEQGRPKWLAKTFLPRVRQLSKKYYFVTKSGFIGMGIAPFKEGDELFVLSDCRVPWVLRKFSDTKYQMVCRAWVGGMMEKELEPLFGNRTFHSRLIHII